MSTFEELKQLWEQEEVTGTSPVLYSEISVMKMVRSRARKHMKESFKYFWASFTLQLIVYGQLSHVMIKYGQNSTILFMSILGILLYVPFTIMLLQKFKKLANDKPLQYFNSGTASRDYIQQQKVWLQSFYRFKTWYECILIPVSCALGVILVFELYVPGGVNGSKNVATVIFLLALASCIFAIYAENQRSFITPLKQLQSIIDDFEKED